MCVCVYIYIYIECLLVWPLKPSAVFVARGNGGFSEVPSLLVFCNSLISTSEEVPQVPWLSVSAWIHFDPCFIKFHRAFEQRKTMKNSKSNWQNIRGQSPKAHGQVEKSPHRHVPSSRQVPPHRLSAEPAVVHQGPGSLPERTLVIATSYHGSASAIASANDIHSLRTWKWMKMAHRNSGIYPWKSMVDLSMVFWDVF